MNRPVWNPSRSLLLLAAVAAVTAADADPGDPDDPRTGDQIAISGLAVRPATGDQPAIGVWRLHPKALAGAGWDSNPGAISDGGDSPVVRLAAGITSSVSLRDDLDLDLSGEITFLRYPRETSYNERLYDLRALATRRGSLTNQRVEAWMTRRYETISDTGDLLPSNTYGADLGVTRPQGRLSFQGRLFGSLVRYQDDVGGIPAEDRDYDRFGGSLGGEYDLAEETSLTSGVQADRILYRETRYNDSVGAWIWGGARTNLASRIIGEVRVGPAWRRYTDDFNRDPAYDDRHPFLVMGDLRVAWSWSRRGTLAATANQGLYDGGGSNSTDGLAGGLEHSLLISRLWIWTVEAGQARYLDNGAPAGLSPNSRTETTAGTGLEFRPRNGFVVRGSASWLRSNRERGDDYDRTVVAVDTAAVF